MKLLRPADNMSATPRVKGCSSKIVIAAIARGRLRGGDLQPVQIEQAALDLANRHAPHMHRDDLLVEARETALIARDQLRGKPPSRSREALMSIFGVSVSTVFFE